MRALIQRVLMSQVRVDGVAIGQIEKGLLVLLGVAPDDGVADRDWLLHKVLNLRIFADGEARMNRSVTDIQGGLLIISQFTLFADVSQGSRPSFIRSAPLEFAESAYNDFLEKLYQNYSGSVVAGRFATNMEVELVNDGPVTLLLDSKHKNF